MNAPSPLVCLVGENGAGKSSLLELLLRALVDFGLTPSAEYVRGDPLEEVHRDIVIAFELNVPLDSILVEDNLRSTYLRPEIKWDGSLIFESNKVDARSRRQSRVYAGGTGERGTMENLGGAISLSLRARPETYCLFIDSDRSYPEAGFNFGDLAQALAESQEDFDKRRKRSSMRSSTIYNEWERNVVAEDARDAIQFKQELIKARNRHAEEPTLVDTMKNYGAAVAAVLPHLHYAGINAKNRLTFDAAGVDLLFSSLSSGEKEIAFIIGQIERFGLKNGLMLLDEPELHLNADIVTRWVTYLKNVIGVGQTWIATHSMEAVEAAGASSTILLERESSTRMVSRADSLESRPVVQLLAQALGTPAFPLRDSPFIYIESADREDEMGDDSAAREISRFERLCETQPFPRFLQGGNCREVLRNAIAASYLASSSDDRVRVGAIIDRDYRDERDFTSIVQSGVHVLGCKEVENLFLHPAALQSILKKTSKPGNASDIIRDAADAMSGRWIFKRALVRCDFSLPIPREASAAAAMDWNTIRKDTAAFSSRLARLLLATEEHAIAAALTVTAADYEALRESDDLWKYSTGKQLLRMLPKKFGVSDAAALEAMVLDSWSDPTLIPAEVTDLRTYIEQVKIGQIQLTARRPSIAELFAAAPPIDLPERDKSDTTRDGNL